jgi:hypothetical protein
VTLLGCLQISTTLHANNNVFTFVNNVGAADASAHTVQSVTKFRVNFGHELFVTTYNAETFNLCYS